MTEIRKILVINPGSTSTKVALYKNEEEVLNESITHSEKDLQPFSHISDQHHFRAQIIEDFLEKHDIDIDALDAVVGRGGLLKPIPGGTYRVNKKMVQELENGDRGEHASNLGGIIAYDIGLEHKLPVFIVDPVVVDEMAPVARFSGFPEIERRSIFHALNQKAAARKAADEIAKKYDAVNLIVAHLGGGISVGAHQKGRVIDVNNALNGDGPFSPERAGGLPAAQLIEICYSGRYDEKKLKRNLVGLGGVVAYLGTNDMRDVQEKVEAGDEESTRIYYAMAYQVAKEIGQCAAVLKGNVDGIVLSGGLAYDPIFTEWIKEHTGWIAPFYVYPGEEEMRSLALGALRVLRGEESASEYD